MHMGQRLEQIGAFDRNLHAEPRLPWHTSPGATPLPTSPAGGEGSEGVAPGHQYRKLPRQCRYFFGVMAGLVPAIHAFLASTSLPSPHVGEGGEGEDVDARDKRGHLAER